MAANNIDIKIADLLLALRARTLELRKNIERSRQHIAAAQERARSLRLYTPEAEESLRRVASLTPRQRQVLEKVLAGEANKSIAFDLGLSQKTVETHRARVMQKLLVRSLPELVRIAMFVLSTPDGKAHRAMMFAEKPPRSAHH